MSALTDPHPIAEVSAGVTAPAPATAAAIDVSPDPRILRERAFIDGQWRDAREHRQVLNPATGAVIGTVPMLPATSVEDAVAAARGAGAAWRALLPQDRAELLLAWYGLMLEHKEALAVLMTLEQGKSLQDARGEIDYGASFVRWFAEEGRRHGGETIPSHLPGKRLWTTRAPVGVVACVTPWNFPSAMLARKAGAALAAGCTVVAAPSMETPLSALALAELALEAGFPPGVFNVVTGEPETVVGTLCDHPQVAALSFTGSTRVGRMLQARCAATVKRMSMELGGHAPFLAFDDVPVQTLVAAAIDAKFQTSGQDCLAANRIYVQRSIYAEFVEAFTHAAASLRVGDGFDAEAAINPLINAAAATRVDEQVQDAVSRGARLMVGGQHHPAGPNWYLPTVLADVDPSMRICREETFGPVAALIPFDDEADLVAAANATEYGLAAYVFTRDVERISRLTEALDFGMVAVNTVQMTGAPIPFGGIKQSGLGREGGRAGIEEFTDVRYCCLGTLA
ncbi:MAG TPA: NAD-dependent succinate-semialdehyde dehydrogenase [Pseudomonadales bacterium]|nr:NAD-dependent succinate-semialdehyde dehydrogenase [Pseudomonadales bacterium]